MEISTEVSIPFLEGFNVIENETISHSIDKTEISNFMLAQKNKFSVPTVVHPTGVEPALKPASGGRCSIH